jgi:hypothetical protein
MIGFKECEMNEFIVWDKDKKEFIGVRNDIRLTFNEDVENGYEVERVYPYDSIEINADIFPYVGKTDINNKNIYADSSIVEFELGTISNKKLKGYFKYSNYTLGYHIILVDDCNKGRAFKFDAELMYDFKIIDTIQENKLGLAK